MRHMAYTYREFSNVRHMAMIKGLCDNIHTNVCDNNAEKKRAQAYKTDKSLFM